MDADGNISIKLSGPHRQLPDLSDFVTVCTALRKCLKNVSRCVSGSEVEYRLCDLRAGSAVVAVAPTVGAVSDSILFDVSFTFERTIRDIRDGHEIDRRLDFQALRSFEGFCKPLRKKDVSLEIAGHALGNDYVSRIAELLEASSPSFGSVSGMLETVSVHLRTRFILYPPIPGEGIECSFGGDELSGVVAAIGQKVTVFGKLFYARTKSFPVRVDVEHFEVDPPDDELPSLLTARGILRPSGLKPQAPGDDDDWD